jgi:esterase/lipase superfamily enzyme
MPSPPEVSAPPTLWSRLAGAWVGIVAAIVTLLAVCAGALALDLSDPGSAAVLIAAVGAAAVVFFAVARAMPRHTKRVQIIALVGASFATVAMIAMFMSVSFMSFDAGPPNTASPIPVDDTEVVIPVFYATDRTRLPGAVIAYGTSLSDDGALLLGRVDVSVPRDHRMGEVERPDVWTFWREDPQRHFVRAGAWQYSYDDFYGTLRAMVARSMRKEAFVFVHGFNVRFDDAVFRTAQIAYDLGFDGAPILYSWPSQESLTPVGYATDAETSEWTAPHLRWFLEDVSAKTGANRIHLIAHSMGNKVLLRALDRMSPASTRKFAQIFMTAPDINAASFLQLADAVRRNGEMATLYASANDAALVASKKLQTFRRVGDTSQGVVVVPGIDTVDVTAVDTDLVGHFYYGDNTSVISDMFLVMTQGLPPSQRPRLRPAGRAPQAFWRFVP